MKARLLAADLLLHLFGLLALLSLPLSPLARELRRPFAEIAVSCRDLSADEVEHLVSRPLVDRLAALPKIEDIYSVSTMEESRIRLLLRRRFDETVLLSRLLRELDELQSSLPKKAGRPELRIIRPSLPPIIIGLRAKEGSFSRERLEAMADDLSRRRELSRVRAAGIPQRELQVHIDPYKLSSLSLQLDDVVRSLHTALLRYSAGPVEEGRIAVPVQISGGIEDAEGLEDFPLPPPVTGLSLKDIAEVTEGFAGRRPGLLAPAAAGGAALLSLLPKSGSSLSMAELLFRFRRPQDWFRELPGYGAVVKTHVLSDPYRALRFRLLLWAVLLLPPLLLFPLLSCCVPPGRALTAATRSLACLCILLRLFRFGPFTTPPILFGSALMTVEFLTLVLYKRPLRSARSFAAAVVVWLIPLVLLGISERKDALSSLKKPLQEYQHYCILDESVDLREVKEKTEAGREVWAFRRNAGSGGTLGLNSGRAWPVEEDIIDLFVPRKDSASILSSSAMAALLLSPDSVEELLPERRASKTAESPRRGDRWEMSCRIETERTAERRGGDSARMHRIIATGIEAAGPGIDLGELPRRSPLRVRLFYGNGAREAEGSAEGTRRGGFLLGDIRRLPILYENRLFSLEELCTVSSFPQATRLIAKNGEPLCLKFHTERSLPLTERPEKP
jgi:hypothetical protein